MNGRRPELEYSRPAALGKSHKVDRDVDFHLLEPRCDFKIAKGLCVDELREGPLQPGTHRAAIIGPQRNADDFEPHRIMRLEHARKKARYGTLPKIGGQISDADFFVAVAFG